VAKPRVTTIVAVDIFKSKISENLVNLKTTLGHVFCSTAYKVAGFSAFGCTYALAFATLVGSTQISIYFV
jgi:hypothetical protein